MATTIKTTEAEKIGTEENESINTNLDKVKVVATEDTTSPEVVPKKEETNQIADKATLENTKNESIDSEETGFEIIIPDPVKITDDAQVKSKSDIVEAPVVKAEPVHAVSKEPEIKQDKDKDIMNEKTNKETSKASLIDIKVIKEPEDSSNKDSPESEAQSSEELELALKAMPELSSSVSKEILDKANDEEAKNIADDIETKTEERPGGTLIDITVIEETNKEKNVQEVIEEAGHSFEAEVIEDNEDIKVIPSEDEDVIEYTLEARHILPFVTILVAFVAIFVALIFYYN